MIKSVIAALALSTAAVAFATPGGEGTNTGCNGVGNPNSPCVPSDDGPNNPGNPGNPTGPNITDSFNNTNTVGVTNNVTGGSVGDVTNTNTATGGSVGDITNRNNNTNTATGGAGGQGGQGGNAESDSRSNAISGSVSGASVGDTSSVSNAVVGDTSLSNVNENAVNNAADNSSTNTVNVTYQNNQRRIPVNTAYAAPLTASFDTCLGSVSAGAQSQLFGISIGGTKRDKVCETIKLAREAGMMGMADVQCQLLSTDDRFAEALERAGRTCNLPTKVEVVMVPVPVPMAEQPTTILPEVESSNFNYAEEYPNDPGERG